MGIDPAELASRVNQSLKLHDERRSPSSQQQQQDNMGDDFVVLESDDGYCFSVPRHIATSSSTLKAMLDEEGAFLLPPSRFPSTLSRSPHSTRGHLTNCAVCLWGMLLQLKRRIHS